jgi:hypothetical protein
LLRRSPIAKPGHADGLAEIGLRVECVEWPHHAREVKAGNRNIQPQTLRREIDLLHRLANATRDIRQQLRYRRQPQSPRLPPRFACRDRAQVVLNAALYCILKRQRDRLSARASRGNAALKQSLNLN